MADLIKLAMNLEDMEEFQPLPAGPYRAEVREVTTKITEGVPNGFFVIKLRVDPNDFPVDYDPENAPEGVALTYANVKLPDGDRRKVKPFKNLLKALGVDASGTSFDPSDWIGKEVQVFVSVNTFQGNLVNNVESIAPLPRV